MFLNAVNLILRHFCSNASLKLRPACRVVSLALSFWDSFFCKNFIKHFQRGHIWKQDVLYLLLKVPPGHRVLTGAVEQHLTGKQASRQVRQHSEAVSIKHLVVISVQSASCRLSDVPALTAAVLSAHNRYESRAVNLIISHLNLSFQQFRKQDKPPAAAGAMQEGEQPLYLFVQIFHISMKQQV